MDDEPDDLEGCVLEFDDNTNTLDEDIDAFVLFADTDFTDSDAVEATAAAWRELGDA
jgi:hypothetical protein